MRSHYLMSCAVAAMLSAWTGSALAAPAQPAVADGADLSGQSPPSAESSPITEVLVTAQRRTENVQNVPATIQALTGQTLSQLNVTSFDDLVKFLPNVTFGSNGPGQGTIFLRGLSAGAAGNQSSATIGNFPNVAIYLDDQSFQFPGRNADIYVADMSRVEVLEGPQGTLFGGGAEAGAIRYITNKPKLNVLEGDFEGGYGFTEGGADNTRVTATLNVPVINDHLAIRAVVYDERQGGYIDNVPSTFTRSNSDLGNAYFNIKPTNGLCPNRLPPGSAGLCAPASPQGNNFATAQNDFNPTTYAGGRISALFKINDDWDVLIAQSVQHLDVDGLSIEEPIGSDFQALKPLQVTAFAPSFDHDKFENTAWTVDGKVGPLKAIYTGGYTERNIDQQNDYTNYSRTGGGVYYQCSGSATGFAPKGVATPTTCYSPIGYWRDQVKNTHFSNEFRLSTPDDWRLRGLGGVFYEKFRIYDNQDFNYKTIPACNAQNLAISLSGGPPCVADVTTAPGSTANIPGVREDDTAFGEDVQRGYDQTAFFASLDFDIIPHVLTISGGTRYYHYKEFETGSQYGTNASCTDVPNGDCASGTVNIDAAHDHVTYSGFRSRANVTWHVTPRTLLYYTFSQGFRPGGFNRAVSQVATGPDGVPQLTRPNGYAPDSLTNNEIGVKTELFDRRLQVNLSAYYENWDNVQVLFYNPTELGNTTFGTNGPNYDIKGVEVQFTARLLQGLTLTGSGSYNNDEQSNSPNLIDNNPQSAGFGKPITQVVPRGSTTAVPFQNPFGLTGSVPAFSPDFKGNLRLRYEREIGAYKAFAMVSAQYVGSQYNEPATFLSGAGVLIPTTTILRYLQPSYATADASIGVSRDRWFAEVDATNLGNSHASTFTTSAQFIKSDVPLRPLVVLMRVGYHF